jgi:hypothetical protein
MLITSVEWDNISWLLSDSSNTTLFGHPVIRTTSSMIAAQFHRVRQSTSLQHVSHIGDAGLVLSITLAHTASSVGVHGRLD